MEISNDNKRAELHNYKGKYSNLVLVGSVTPTPAPTPDATKPKTIAVKPHVANSILMASTLQNATITNIATRIKPPAIVPIIPMVTAPVMPSGGGGGGGGSDSSSDSEKAMTPAGKDHTMIVTGLSLLAGAGAGFFIAKKLGKNNILGTTIGALALGVAGYFTYTKFILKGTEKKSGFIRPDIDGACYCSSGAGAGTYSAACCNKNRTAIRKCWAAGPHGMVQVPCNDSTK